MTNRQNLHRKEQGLRPWNKIELDAHLIQELYTSGMSENSISHKFDVSRFVIRRILLELGIEPRSRSEAEKIKWSRMTSAQRIRQTSKAHDTVRGKPRKEGEMISRAITRQKTLSKVVASEIELLEVFRRNRIKAIPQAAIGRYNVDFLVGSIAVELYIHSNLPHHRDGQAEKIVNLIDSGLSVVYLSSRRWPPHPASIKKLISTLKILRKNPPTLRQYWMIRSQAQGSGFRVEVYDRAGVLTGERLLDPT